MRVASLVLATVGGISLAHAGDVRHDPPVFATEIIQPNGPNDLIMPATDLAYVFGIAPDGRQMSLRLDFEPARLNSPIAAGRASLEINSPFGDDAVAAIDVVDGGRPGDDFVVFSVRLNGIVSAGDAIAIDLEGIAMRIDGRRALADQPVEIDGTLRDNNGVLDANGRRTATLFDARPCVSLDLQPGGRGLAATPRETFVGLPRTTDDTSWLDLALAECRAADGSLVDGIEDLGALQFDVTGQIAGIDRVDIPGLGVFERLQESISLGLEVGPIDYAGPINVRVDGRTRIAEQTLQIAIEFRGRVPGTNRRLIGPTALTRWEPIDRRQIVDVIRLDPGLDCEAGGVRIVRGVDQNYNGELDEGEITESELICNGTQGDSGTPGLSVVQSVEPAPPSEACPEGGWRISSGQDANRDGRLQADEVEVEALLCNGADGEDGEQGPAGPLGRAGNPGPAGPLGERGPQGEQGEAGPQGESGCAAAPGAPSAWWGLLALLGLTRRRRYS